MSLPESRIDLYLANYYNASQLGIGDRTQVEQAFSHLIEADEGFKADAKTKLAALTKPIRDRDHVSRIYYDILTRVLPHA